MGARQRRFNPVPGTIALAFNLTEIFCILVLQEGVAIMDIQEGSIQNKLN